MKYLNVEVKIRLRLSFVSPYIKKDPINAYVKTLQLAK